MHFLLVGLLFLAVCTSQSLSPLRRGWPLDSHEGWNTGGLWGNARDPLSTQQGPLGPCTGHCHSELLGELFSKTRSAVCAEPWYHPLCPYGRKETCLVKHTRPLAETTLCSLVIMVTHGHEGGHRRPSMSFLSGL